MTWITAAEATTARRPQPVAFGLAAAAGALLGVSGWLSDSMGYPWGILLPGNAIGAWVAVAFVAGALGPGRWSGAARGALALVAATVAYYLFTGVLGYGAASGGASHAATVWGGIAIVVGPALGLAGATWRGSRPPWRGLAVAPLAAALIGEGIAFQGVRSLDAWFAAFDPRLAFLTGEAILGALLPVLLLRRGERPIAWLATAILGAAAVVSVGPVSMALRAIADRF